MIRFNSLLRNEGIDPKHVKLVRHQDKRYPGRPTAYQLWRAKDGRFEQYQSFQGRPVFANARQLASFVATPLDETLFVGLYEIGKVGKVPKGTRDPLSDHDISGLHLYHLTLSKSLKEYRGRLIVEWGKGFRSWVQRAAKQDKEVLEISRKEQDPPFPGFLDFRKRLSDLRSVPPSWRTVLASVHGI